MVAEKRMLFLLAMLTLSLPSNLLSMGEAKKITCPDCKKQIESNSISTHRNWHCQKRRSRKRPICEFGKNFADPGNLTRHEIFSCPNNTHCPKKRRKKIKPGKKKQSVIPTSNNKSCQIVDPEKDQVHEDQLPEFMKNIPDEELPQHFYDQSCKRNLPLKFRLEFKRLNENLLLNEKLPKDLYHQLYSYNQFNENTDPHAPFGTLLNHIQSDDGEFPTSTIY